MLRASCSLVYLLVFMLLTTVSSRTANNGDIAGALDVGSSSVHASDNIDYNNGYMQHTVQDYTDQGDWDISRQSILNEALSRLSTARSVEDVLRLGLVGNNGNPLTPEDLSAFYDNKTDKLMISGSAQMAVPDECTVREVTMVVNIPEVHANTLFHPKCIKVMKCGGCCSVTNVVCEPAATEKVVYNLFKISVEKGESVARMTGVYPLEVVQHTRCRCSCSLSQDTCGPLKTFEARMCACRCSSYKRCSPPHYFDPATCRCECAYRDQCCSHGYQCELSFNDTTCQCEFHDKMFIASATNQTQGQTNDDSSHAVGDEKSRLPQSTPQTVETTRVLAADPCLGVVCPLHFERRVNSEGRCVCSNTKRPRYPGRK